MSLADCAYLCKFTLYHLQYNFNKQIRISLTSLRDDPLNLKKTRLETCRNSVYTSRIFYTNLRNTVHSTGEESLPCTLRN